MRLVVPGRPVAQGSKKHVGHGVMVEMGVGLKEWRTDVKQTAIQMGWHPEPGYVSMRLDFYLLRPKGHMGTGRNAGQVKASAPTHPSRPDLDKLARAILDALTGVAFLDDGQVALLVAAKHYTERNPGVHIEVTPLGRVTA